MRTIRHLTTGAAALAVVALVISGCSTSDTQDGPLEFGSASPTPDRSVCVAEVPSSDVAWFGERATNRSNADVTILAVDPQQVSGLNVHDIQVRVMEPTDPHFLAFADSSANQPEFAAGLRGLTDPQGVILHPGDALGIVIDASIESGQVVGEIMNLRITYEAEGGSFASHSATTLQMAAEQCES